MHKARKRPHDLAWSPWGEWGTLRLSRGLAELLDLGCVPRTRLAKVRSVLAGTAAVSAVEVPVSQPSPRLAAEPTQTNILDLRYYSLIKLQHMCYRSSQFWLRTIKSWVISITFRPQCLLKRGSGGRILLYPWLPECTSVLLDLCNNTQLFNFYLFCFT